MVQDSVLHWAAHAESDGLRGRLDSTMQGRYILQSSFPRNLPPVLGLLILWYNWARKSYHVQWTQILEWYFSGEKRKLEDAAVHTDSFYSRDDKNEGEGSLG